jgi:hypothetical protein
MMKKTLWILFIVSILAGFNSCKSILMKVNRVSKPAIETKESIQSYLSTNSYTFYDSLFVAKDSTSFFKLVEMVVGFPSVDFFNSRGELLEYSTTGDCTGKADHFAVNLQPDSNYRIDSSYLLKEVMDKLKGIHGMGNMSGRKFDFTVLIYWAKYLGNVNNNALAVMKTVQNNKKIRCRIYLIDLDFQNDWGMKAIPQITFQ